MPDIPVLTTTAPEVDTVGKHSPFGAMLSRTLPRYRGVFPVGVCDVELPVPHETFGNFTHKGMSDNHGSAGLSLDTVLYSIYYPTTDDTVSKKVIWFPNPWQTIDGFLRMARRTPNFLYRAVAYPLIAAAIYGTTFPAKPNTPLREPPPEFAPLGSNKKPQWPLVIFSHGVGCSRLMYSTFCGEMASRGYIVCGIEHRDGTSPCSTIVAEDGKAKTLNWLQWSDIYWPDLPENEQPKDDTILRHSQLEMRITEIFYVIDSMARLSAGQDITRTSVKSPDMDWTRWHGAVAADRPIMTGHSLGGSAAILAGADTKRFDFASIVAFDPAVQRLDNCWSAPIAAPLLIVNSEEFKKSSEYPLLPAIATHAPRFAGAFSISGATHPSFSDVFLIIPGFVNKLTGLKIPPTRVFSHSLRAVIQFLDGAGSKELSETAAHHTLFDFHEDIPGTYDPASEVEGALGANGLDPAGRSRSSSAAVTPGLATPPVFWGGAPPKDDKALASLSVPNGNAKSASKHSLLCGL